MTVLLKGGRVIDPSQKIDDILDVSRIMRGKINLFALDALVNMAWLYYYSNDAEGAQEIAPGEEDRAGTPRADERRLLAEVRPGGTDDGLVADPEGVRAFAARADTMLGSLGSLLSGWPASVTRAAAPTRSRSPSLSKSPPER
mgnify:CR=1 FL=1